MTIAQCNQHAQYGNPPPCEIVTILVRGTCTDYDANDLQHKEELRRIINRFLHMVFSELNYPAICLPLGTRIDIYLARLMLRLQLKKQFTLWIYPDEVELSKLDDEMYAQYTSLLENPQCRIAENLSRNDVGTYELLFGSSDLCLFVQYGQDDAFSAIIMESLRDMLSHGSMTSKHIELHAIDN